MSNFSVSPGPITVAIRNYRETGSQTAFTYLYEEFKGLVAKIAQQKLGKSAKLMDVDDVVQSVMRRVAQGFDQKKTWFLNTATNEDALRGMLCHMTAWRCLNVIKYESVPARRTIQRDADRDENSLAASRELIDSDSDHEVQYQFDQVVEQIRASLMATHPTQGPQYARVFDGLLKYETIAEIAAALGTSTRTVDRRLETVRSIVTRELEKIDSEMLND